MIEMQGITFAYNVREKIFSNLQLNIQQGGICGLLGKNGSGKTTLLKIIAGLIFPDAGTYSVLAQCPQLRTANFLSDIYFLPEDFYVPAITAKQYVKFYADFYPKFDNSLFDSCLKEFDLSDQKDLTQLSHGQRKKFLIAFGIATNTKVFILDEPTNGLDIPAKAQFRKLLATHISDERLFIISTHQVHDVENLIDSVVMLEQGNIIFHANLEKISQYLSFTQQFDEPDFENTLYYEKNFNGYHIVAKNNDLQNQTHVDLELLFNTVLLQKDKIQQLFNQTGN